MLNVKANWCYQVEEDKLTIEIVSLTLKHIVQNAPGENYQFLLQKMREHPCWARVSSAVSENRPIQFILPAFPGKSANRLKTLGALPDAGEFWALKSLFKLSKSIGKIYSPGAKFTICSDGRVFSDVVGITENAVTRYNSALKDIVRNYGWEKYIEIIQLDQFFPSQDFSQARRFLIEGWGSSLEEIKRLVANDQSEKQLFNGLHRFLFEDYLYIWSHLSRSAVRKKTKELTYKVIQRSHAWSRFVESHFESAIRLTIHPQIDLMSRKLWMPLVPQFEGSHKSGKGTSGWSTPWHRSPVKIGHEIQLISVKEANEMGAVLSSYEGFPCFEFKNSATVVA